jgi:RNA polymerase sigma-70 factor (sigma-E family)
LRLHTAVALTALRLAPLIHEARGPCRDRHSSRLGMIDNLFAAVGLASARTDGFLSPGSCNSSCPSSVLDRREVGVVEDFGSFVRDRTPALLRYGFVLSGNPHDAADLAQEALARLGERWSKVSARGDPEGYVRTTMARLHISWWRRRRREHPVRVLPEQSYVDAGIAEAEGDLGLWRAVTALPPRQRAVLMLRYHEQLSDEEIARLLGVSRGTVRSQAARGLDKLRDVAESQVEVRVNGR